MTFPEKVCEYVEQHYRAADTILEYGSGGSTVLASELSGKTIFSVESDKRWSLMMQAYFDQAGAKSAVTLHYSNIGKTGEWGMPVSDAAWRRYHRYPLSVWDLPNFKAPDLMLIDGRFRVACLITAMMKTEKPLVVLFDDYADRERYAVVEKWIKPQEFRGRMARFEVEPSHLPRADMTEFFSFFNKWF